LAGPAPTLLSLGGRLPSPIFGSSAPHAAITAPTPSATTLPCSSPPPSVPPSLPMPLPSAPDAFGRTEEPLRPERIARVQTRLRELGFSASAATRVWDTNTRDA